MVDTECRFKSHDYILFFLFTALTIFGLLGFFFIPKDAPTVLKVVELLAVAVSDVLSFKFGIHQAQAQTLPPGTSQLTSAAVPPTDPKDKEHVA